MSDKPKRYGACQCPCHRTGAKHAVPCCTPADGTYVNPTRPTKPIVEADKGDGPTENK